MGIKQLLTPLFVLALVATSVSICMPQPAQAVPRTENFMMFNMADEAPSSKIKVLNARIIIDAPPVFVWQTLTSYTKLKDFVPGYHKSNLLSADSNGKVLEVVMSVARFLPNYHYKVRVMENKQSYELKMNRISGDFNHLSATYQLYPKNNGNQTVLAYSIKIDPGMSIPGINVNSVLQGNAERTLKAIEAHSEQEHRKSLIGQR